MGFLIMRVLNKNEGCNLDDIQKENVESHHNWKVCHCCLLLLSEGFQTVRDPKIWWSPCERLPSLQYIIFIFKFYIYFIFIIYVLLFLPTIMYKPLE